MLKTSRFFWVSPTLVIRRLLEIEETAAGRTAIVHWVFDSISRKWMVAFTGVLLRENNKGITVQSYVITGRRTELHYSNTELEATDLDAVRRWEKNEGN